jgi:hypothetical protein
MSTSLMMRVKASACSRTSFSSTAAVGRFEHAVDAERLQHSRERAALKALIVDD